MNVKKYFVIAVLGIFNVSVLTPSALQAQDAVKSEKTLDAVPAVAPTGTKTRDEWQRDYADGYLAQRLGAMQLSTRLIGASIQDTASMPLGKVADLLVNLHSGTIYCALVSRGDANLSR